MSDDKPYRLTLINREFYVYAHVKADAITPEISAEYLAEIVESCKKFGKDRLLIYRDIPEMLSPENIRNVSTDFVALVGGIKTAAVNPYLSPPVLEDSTKHLPHEKTFHVFTNFKEAEAWLLSDD